VACGQREHTLGGIDAENMAGAAAGEPARECAVAAPDIQYVAAGDSGQQAGEGRLLQVLIESRAALAHLLVAREKRRIVVYAGAWPGRSESRVCLMAASGRL
jgi:hypothetical protein